MAEDKSPNELLELFQKMWGPTSFPFPGLMTPALNAEDVEKKIAELKAVEGWLSTNIGFLQLTIKTLEMQKAALETLAASRDKSPKPG